MDLQEWSKINLGMTVAEWKRHMEWNDRLIQIGHEEIVRYRDERESLGPAEALKRLNERNLFRPDLLPSGHAALIYRDAGYYLVEEEVRCREFGQEERRVSFVFVPDHTPKEAVKADLRRKFGPRSDLDDGPARLIPFPAPQKNKVAA